MASQNRYEGIESYVINFIRKEVNRIIGRYGYHADDFEDIEQELHREVLIQQIKYDPSRGTQTHFICMVVRRRIENLIAHQKAAMRDFRKGGCSLNEPLDYEGEEVERIETIGKEDFFLKASDDRMDVEDFIHNLPGDLKPVAIALSERSPTEVSRLLNIKRTTLYDKIKKIRKLFSKKFRHFDERIGM